MANRESQVSLPSPKWSCNKRSSCPMSLILLFVSVMLPLGLVFAHSSPRVQQSGGGGGGGKSALLVTIDESNWRQVLEGEWMVEFYAPWCPACKSLQATWESFAGWGPDLGIKVGQCDVTKSAGLSGRFLVTALPTIYHVKDGVFRQYQGARDKDVFISFIEDKRWEKVDPVPFWQSPSSFHMTVVSEFFRFSNYLRDLHKYLVEEYGVSTWGSYALFGVTTIIVGALLGLFLVCVMDYLNPPKPYGGGDSSVFPDSSAGGDGVKARATTAATTNRGEGEEQESADEISGGSRGEDDGSGDATNTSQDEGDGTEEEEEEEEEADEAEETAAEPTPASTTTTTTERDAAAGDGQPRRRPRRAD